MYGTFLAHLWKFHYWTTPGNECWWSHKCTIISQIHPRSAKNMILVWAIRSNKEIVFFYTLPEWCSSSNHRTVSVRFRERSHRKENGCFRDNSHVYSKFRFFWATTNFYMYFSSTFTNPAYYSLKKNGQASIQHSPAHCYFNRLLQLWSAKRPLPIYLYTIILLWLKSSFTVRIITVHSLISIFYLI